MYNTFRKVSVYITVPKVCASVYYLHEGRCVYYRTKGFLFVYVTFTKVGVYITVPKVFSLCMLPSRR